MAEKEVSQRSRATAHNQGKRSRVTLVALLVSALLATVIAVTATVSPAAAVTDCSVPVTVPIRGVDTTLDQCYDLDFTNSGTDYAIHVYYRETVSAANTQESALADGDDANGDNLDVVSMAAEVRDAVSFYIDQDFNWPQAGVTDIDVWIGEDPRGGGISGSDTIYVDDEWIDGGDPLTHRVLAYHEVMHLVQSVNDGSIGWDSTYGEGIARAIEDRVDPVLDALTTGQLFIGEVQGVLGTDGDRTSDLLTNGYRTVLWWTWLMDQYRTGGEADPLTGWDALEDFYAALAVAPDEGTAIYDFISGQGSSFEADWIDYTLALYAHEFDPLDGRLDFLDPELVANGGGLSGHTVITGGPAFATTSEAISPRSSQYWEFNPAGQCDFVAFDFDGNGQDFGFSVMTVDDSGDLDERWSSQSDTYARTVATDGLSRVVGVVTGLRNGGTVDVGRGCVEPTLQIKSPTSAAFAMVGAADNPEIFIARIDVDGAGGSPVAGLTSDAFDVSLTPSGGGAAIPADIISSAYVLDDYWLAVQAPNSADGATTGSFYNLTVDLGTSATDTNNQSVLYVDQEEDVIVVLDKSGSMGGSTGKLEAAQNAAELLFTNLADSDQAGYIAFDANAIPRVNLDELDAGQRSDLENEVTAETAGGSTSIGDGMQSAAAMHDGRQDPDHVCSFVLLSDGHENQPAFWDDVKADVRDNECPIHVIALGPEAQEPLLQEIGSQPAGSTYDYAESAGSVPIGGNSGSGASGGASGGAGGANPGGALSWENNLSRVYDYKAIELQGRQRLMGEAGFGNSECGGETTLIDFDDQPNSSFEVGTTFISNGTPISVQEYHYGNGQTGAGRYLINESAYGADIGSGQRALPSNTVGYIDGLEACRVTAEVQNFGGSVNLSINGDLAVAQSLSDLDGATIGDVVVRYYKERDLLVLNGDIYKFGIGGQEFVMDNIRIQALGQGHTFRVDETTDLISVAVAWQTDIGGAQTVKLIDPDGNPVAPSELRNSPRGTNEVAEVKEPQPGIWTAYVDGVGEEYYISAAAHTQLELKLFVGEPSTSGAGAEVPITGMLISPKGPVVGADVDAMITPPGEAPQSLPLFDDGNHGDGEAGDGVYGNVYTATITGDVQDREPVDGKEIGTVGSYLVDVIAEFEGHRREAQGSFAIRAAVDSDQDGAPDSWEEENGLNPKNPYDGLADNDFDLLSNACEFWHGTDPNNSDTDGGGEADGSEVRKAESQFVLPASPIPNACGDKIRNPFDPDDDAGGPTVSILATPEANRGRPLIHVAWSAPLSGEYRVGTLWRRAGNSDWERLTTLTERVYHDTDVEDGKSYRYLIQPTANTQRGPILTNVPRSDRVTATSDPEAPEGHVLINEGAAETTSTDVVLTIEATDSGSAHGGPASLGTDRDDLEMRLSDSPMFEGSWKPFAEKVEWDLGPLSPGETGQVFVQFRDEQGNVSGSSLGWTDSIVYVLPPVVAMCDGKVVTINMNTNGGNGMGTPGDDVILGRPVGDVINARGGDDTVCAGGGDDTVFAGAGDDRVFGEAGRDTIYGSTGRDYVHGGYGDDVIVGQGGLDTLYGNPGVDRIWGMGSNDFIYGGRGNDILRGNGGVDRIWGGPDLDQIWGGNLGDYLYGEGTRDIIRGGGGADTIEGGDGDDDLYGEANTDRLTGGAGFDRFDGGGGVDNCTDVALGEPSTSCP